MKTLTRFLIAASIGALALMLAGCFDVYQHITREKDGHVSVYFKIAMSKAFLSMANSAGGSTSTSNSTSDGDSNSNSQPPSDPLADFQNSPMVTAAKGIGSSITSIDNDTEFGVVMQSSLDLKSRAVQDAMNSPAGPLVPQVSNKGITLFFPSQGSSSDKSDKDQNSAAILTSFKYRLSVGKSLMPSLSRAVLRTGGTETVIVAVDLPDMYLIEIPLSSVFSSADAQLVLMK
jgi:hypothetical protein